jgi:4-diphosphocytidyl-2-C-methyl-D-erythritol kinase
MPVTLRSYAKINLGLRIGPLQSDGYHALTTVYQTISLWDGITVSVEPAAQTEITIHCADARVPRDHRNTCWRIAAAALSALGMHAQVEITIDKRLPVQGGLGAGSSNAAVTLLALESELAARGTPALPDAERMQLAAAVGSDVPLFLLGGAVLGTGRGELVAPLIDARPLDCVIALPNLAVSTPQAFRDWDALCARKDLQAGEENGPENDTENGSKTLTPTDPAAKLKELGRVVAEVWPQAGPSGVSSVGGGLAEDPLLALVQTGIENDFEQVVFPQQPLLRDLKSALAGSDSSYNLSVSVADQAIYAALSGSGAALFGLYHSPAAAQSAAERVQAAGSNALVTSTLGREQYWQGMKSESQ